MANASGLLPRPMAAMLLGAIGLAGDVSAQMPILSPAQLSDGVMPVRVVCIADSPEAFLRDETFRNRVMTRLLDAVPADKGVDAESRMRALIVPLARRFVVPVGSGFVVDSARRHVVSNWHVVTACTGERAAGRQIGIVEADGGDIVPIEADRLPDRTFQDASGNPVKLVQALCRDKRETCGADLPRGADDKLLTEAVRRRQLDNLLAYAPDLAVLRLHSAARTTPLALALNEQLDDQMRLVIRGFAPLPARPAEADAAGRVQLAKPVSAAAIYTGPHQISYRPLGGQPEDEIHAKLHRLDATVHPGLEGGPVLRGTGVVGVLMTLFDGPQRPAGAASGSVAAAATPAYAVPVSVVAVFLDLLKVPYVAAPLDLPLRESAAPARPALPPTRPWWTAAQLLMLAGAAVLVLLAGAAFVALARRNRQRAAAAAPTRPQALLPPQRTITRLNPTLLHAVAMPTAAVEPPAAEAAIASPQAMEPLASAVSLRCSAGPLAPSLFSLPMPNGGTTLFVGRDVQSCQVVFPATMDRVSGVHACFVWNPPTRALTVRDLSSSGSWVNGQRIDKGRTVNLAAGDQVDLGGPGINRFTVERPVDFEPTLETLR